MKVLTLIELMRMTRIALTDLAPQPAQHPLRALTPRCGTQLARLGCGERYSALSSVCMSSSTLRMTICAPFNGR